ncbi:hypothetical protein [Chryseobacterium sp. H1D6B]|uniref:hypothetical protein n=1 Tax=Chryseobacterium sp. H1D6B TaxID=2940588 RepID=UPI0015CC76DC|nr:hypothetical protein [Chryseobacterium sp. H1D6B]
MRKIILSIVIACSALSIQLSAQVGINTPNPASTLDLAAKNATGTTTNIDGLLIPRVDRQRAQSMTAIPVSTLIYVNSIATGTAAGIAVNIDAVGYYFYDGTVWTKMPVNLYNSNGTLTGNRTVTQGASTLAFTGTAVNAFSVDGTTLSIDAANHRIGIGTAVPENKFQVVSTTPVSNRFTLFDGPAGTNQYVITSLRNTAPVATGNYALLGFTNTGPTSGGAAWGIGSIRTGNTGLVSEEDFFVGNSLGGGYLERMRVTSAGNVGIGISAPTNLLHVNGTNPLRLQGLQASSASAGTLAVNSSGVVQLLNSASISAVRATGNVTITVNNTLTNAISTVETFDNLNEFTGNTFTASLTGMYKVDFQINYPQRATTEDSGDGYLAYSKIALNGVDYTFTSTKVPIQEISGAVSFVTCMSSALVKMNAGDVLTFQGQSYGSTPTVAVPLVAPYTVSIVRID